jgi:hypothetical protein
VWPLVERKRRLRQLIPSVPMRLLSVGHVQVRGSDFFEVACARPRGNRGEARQRSVPCGRHEHQLVQMKNPAYTQMTARHELFDRRTGSRRRGLMLRVHKVHSWRRRWDWLSSLRRPQTRSTLRRYRALSQGRDSVRSSDCLRVKSHCVSYPFKGHPSRRSNGFLVYCEGMEIIGSSSCASGRRRPTSRT